MPTKTRVCSTPGCPTLHNHTSGKCTACRREYETARGTATERGYGHEHRTLGDAAIRSATTCETCGSPFTTDNPVTRGHRVDIRNGGTSADGYFPQCRRCNYGWRRGQRDTNTGTVGASSLAEGVERTGREAISYPRNSDPLRGTVTEGGGVPLSPFPTPTGGEGSRWCDTLKQSGLEPDGDAA